MFVFPRIPIISKLAENVTAAFGTCRTRGKFVADIFFGKLINTVIRALISYIQQ